MPAKTVIFPKLTKYSNNDFRPLKPTNIYKWQEELVEEGLDKFGTVIILPDDELMDLHLLKKMIVSKSPSINSRQI